MFHLPGQTGIAIAINVSPESFHKDSVAVDPGRLVSAILEAEAKGARMIDIGAMSTAPYREAWVDPEEECRRMAWAVRAARATTRLPISVDTQRAIVAEAALAEGADIINDISALRADPAMGAIAARAGGVILMVREEEDLDEGGRAPAQVVADLLSEALERAGTHEIPNEKVILDPGLGFFRKRSIPWHEWDLEILRHLPLFQALGCPLMIGASRKSFLGHLLDEPESSGRLAGSLAVASWCALQRVEWLRVHDVKETADVIRMMELVSKP
jgi:dihydropteroate synthase